MTHPEITVDDVVRVSLTDIRLAKEPTYVKVTQSQPTHWLTTAAKVIVGCVVLAVVAIVLSLVLGRVGFWGVSSFFFFLAGLIALLARFRLAEQRFTGENGGHNVA